ncbi:hypothetical protein ACFVZ3_15140 [Kitasatospora purpeofusca]|uniref:hypothetical protein n=1 Tax=Kitasatospora purpeofusca TaxID=67352 RepID=UPI0036AA1F8D
MPRGKDCRAVHWATVAAQTYHSYTDILALREGLKTRAPSQLVDTSRTEDPTERLAMTRENEENASPAELSCEELLDDVKNLYEHGPEWGTAVDAAALLIAFYAKGCWSHDDTYAHFKCLPWEVDYFQMTFYEGGAVWTSAFVDAADWDHSKAYWGVHSDQKDATIWWKAVNAQDVVRPDLGSTVFKAFQIKGAGGYHDGDWFGVASTLPGTDVHCTSDTSYLYPDHNWFHLMDVGGTGWRMIRGSVYPSDAPGNDPYFVVRDCITFDNHGTDPTLRLWGSENNVYNMCFLGKHD